jgi:hypothetical protein
MDAPRLSRSLCIPTALPLNSIGSILVRIADRLELRIFENILETTDVINNVINEARILCIYEGTAYRNKQVDNIRVDARVYFSTLILLPIKSSEDAIDPSVDMDEIKPQ